MPPSPFGTAKVVAIAAACALAGCRASPQQVADGDDPLAALTVTAESHRFTDGYWREQARTDSAGRPSAWTRAVAYCGESVPRPGLEADGAKPNCHSVHVVGAELAQRRALAPVVARAQAAHAQYERMLRDTAYRRHVNDSLFQANKF